MPDPTPHIRTATKSVEQCRKIFEQIRPYLEALETRVVSLEGSVAAGYAPVGEPFVTIGNTGNLTAERALTAGTGISLTDGGANSTATIASTITQYTDAMVLALLTDANIPNTITLDNITQITTRSHTSLSDIGTNTHAQIDTHLAASAPHSGHATTAGTLAQFAATTSAQLRGVISDETGGGAAVFNDTPTLLTPVFTGLPTGTGVSAAESAASTLAARDSNANLASNAFVAGYYTEATAAGITSITASENQNIYFTGVTTHTLRLPVASTLVLGHQFNVVNNSTGVVTVQSSGTNTILAMVPGSMAQFTVVDTTLTTAAAWNAEYTGFPTVTGTGANVLATSPTLVTPALGTPASGTLTNCTGLPTAGLVDDAVTYAKMQNVSATDKLLGRSTAGAGNVEEITCTAAGRALLDDAAASNQRTTLGLDSVRRWTIPFDALSVDLPASGAADPTVTPTTLRPCIAFDKDTDETCILQGIVPNNYGSGTLKLRILYCANTTTEADDARIDVVTEFITLDVGENMDTDAFDATPDSATLDFDFGGASDAYDLFAATITLTPATTPAVGDSFRIKVTRDANNASSLDDLAQDLLVIAFELFEEY